MDELRVRERLGDRNVTAPCNQTPLPTKSTQSRPTHLPCQYPFSTLVEDKDSLLPRALFTPLRTQTLHRGLTQNRTSTPLRKPPSLSLASLSKRCIQTANTMDYQGYTNYQGDIFTDEANMPNDQVNTFDETFAMDENNVWSDNLTFKGCTMNFNQTIPDSFTSFTQSNSFDNQENNFNEANIWDGTSSFGQGDSLSFDQLLDQGDFQQGIDSNQPLLHAGFDCSGWERNESDWNNRLVTQKKRD